MLHLKTIDKTNWEACAALKPKPEQERLIASNLYSIAEAQFLSGFSSMAIYQEASMIGYTLFGVDSDDQNYWIYRLMIDQQYQGIGYGALAVQVILNQIQNRTDCTAFCLIGYHPDNGAAKRVYEKAGFVEEGLAPRGEMIAKYRYIRSEKNE